MSLLVACVAFPPPFDARGPLFAPSTDGRTGAYLDDERTGKTQTYMRGKLRFCLESYTIDDTKFPDGIGNSAELAGFLAITYSNGDWPETFCRTDLGTKSQKTSRRRRDAWKVVWKNNDADGNSDAGGGGCGDGSKYNDDDDENQIKYSAASDTRDAKGGYSDTFCSADPVPSSPSGWDWPISCRRCTERRFNIPKTQVLEAKYQLHEFDGTDAGGGGESLAPDPANSYPARFSSVKFGDLDQVCYKSGREKYESSGRSVLELEPGKYQEKTELEAPCTKEYPGTITLSVHTTEYEEWERSCELDGATCV